MDMGGLLVVWVLGIDFLDGWAVDIDLLGALVVDDELVGDWT